MIRDRVWEDLCNSFFYEEFLGLYINGKKSTKIIIKIVSISLNIIGLAGWYRYSSLSLVWLILLFLVMVFNWVKDHFVISDEKLFVLDKTHQFYIERSRHLEDLWYDLFEEKITEDQANRKYKKLNNEELNMIKTFRHEKIEGTKKMIAKASQGSYNRLNKYIENGKGK
ncbi:hypothetical protein HER15_14230 [Tenacibaculum mesophilum]|uniref:Uncharacterized protein n=1 Tax=Tenacibaculum mesophilum TaxID=104268 RepID=A0AAE9MQS4_9FLAO|nr:hypothetical protein [Tenacibaculum mesophilum]UTD16563.1 hypothetical protein HER15_14230 [Tenacibaculum mesophilum]